MSKDTFEMPFDEKDNSVEEFKAVIFNVFKDHLVEKVKDIVPSFVEKDCDYNVIDTYQEVVDENPELVENLDEFIDGFEYETLEEGEEIYLDENYDFPLEEYAADDFEELSDAQLEELLVEHGSGEYEEVYFDEEIYLDDEVYPDEEDSIYYDEVPLEETADEPLVEEIYVEHGNDEHFVEEIYVEHDKGEPLVEEVYVERDSDEPMVEEIFVEHDDEEVIYEDVPVEEVYLDENLNDVSSEESIGEYADESDGWAEYIEEEFGDSVDDSQESDDSDRQN